MTAWRPRGLHAPQGLSLRPARSLNSEALDIKRTAIRCEVKDKDVTTARRGVGRLCMTCLPWHQVPVPEERSSVETAPAATGETPSPLRLEDELLPSQVHEPPRLILERSVLPQEAGSASPGLEEPGELRLLPSYDAAAGEEKCPEGASSSLLTVAIQQLKPLTWWCVQEAGPRTLQQLQYRHRTLRNRNSHADAVRSDRRSESHLKEDPFTGRVFRSMSRAERSPRRCRSSAAHISRRPQRKLRSVTQHVGSTGTARAWCRIAS